MKALLTLRVTTIDNAELLSTCQLIIKAFILFGGVDLWVVIMSAMVWLHPAFARKCQSGDL